MKKILALIRIGLLLMHVFQDTEGRPNTPMKQITHLLSSQEMQAVAGYLQAFPSDK